MKIIILMLFLSFSTFSQNLFSVSIGNRWIYHNVDDESKTIIKEVIGEEFINSQKWAIVSDTFNIGNNHPPGVSKWFVDSLYYKYDHFSLLWGFNHYGFNKEILRDTIIFDAHVFLSNNLVFGENVCTQEWIYFYSQIGEVYLEDMTKVSKKFGVVEFWYRAGGPGFYYDYHYELVEAIIDGITYTNVTANNDEGQSNFPEYYLFQNYPNPFNPNTTIKFSIPSTQFVTIKVFDLLGRELETLVNEEKSVGNYELKFDGSNLSSGIYFYKMQAGDFTETKKLILME